MWVAGTIIEAEDELNGLWMHDAQIISEAIDYEAGTVVLMLRVYEDQDSPRRALCRLTFGGVEAVNQIADVVHLAANASAGNINAWRVHAYPRKTYIDLTEGCIEVLARTISLTIVEAPRL